MAIKITVIRGGDVVTRHQILRQAEVWVQNGRIIGIHPFGQVTIPLGAKIINAKGLLVTPGWIDLQINGGFGHDFTAHPESIWEVAARLPQYGTTSFLATIITAAPDAYERAIQVWKKGPPADWKGAMPVGLHFEGPYLNPEKKGAHNPALFRLPELKEISAWRPENGVKMVTLAPELPGALSMAHELHKRGVVVSAGHSQATFEQAMTSFEAGVTCGTHLFNAMPNLAHRDPGLAGALLTAPQTVVGLIVDGLHIHPAMVKLTWQAKGRNGLVLITDAMAALGMPPGVYQLGDFEVNVDDRSARLSSGNLAGSLLSQDAALRNLVEYCGCNLVDAIPALSNTPATLLNLTNKGAIRPSADADLTLVTPQGKIAQTVVAGEVLYNTI